MVTRKAPLRPVRPRIPIDPVPQPLPGPLPRPLPGQLVNDFTSSLFDSQKPGLPAVRPDDMAALCIELVNLSVVLGPPPLVRRSSGGGAGPAFLVLHFPPQAIGEQAFFQSAQPSKDGGPPDEKVDKPQGRVAEKPGSRTIALPARARIAGESRLVFEVPDPFETPYTLAGLLDACQRLAPSVAANTLPRGARAPSTTVLVTATKRDIEALSTREQVGLNRLNARLATAATATASTTVIGGNTTGVDPASEPQLQRLRLGATFGGLKPFPGGIPEVVVPPWRFRNGPRPGEPGATQTAIELPWRLVLSPHAGERFQHATVPVTGFVARRTELWHTRLVLPDADGWISPVQRPDPDRSVRAVHARTDDTREQLKPDFPTGGNGIPAPSE